MKKIIEKVKGYFGFEEPLTVTVGDDIRKWKTLAIELNNDLQAERKVNHRLVKEVQRLQAIVDCQGELLAERKV